MQGFGAYGRASRSWLAGVRAHPRTLAWTCWALAVLLTLLLDASRALAPLETALSDHWHALAGRRQASPDVALVMVDDATLAEYPDDPLIFWTPHWARALQVLREVGVRVVGLDVLLSLSPQRWLQRQVGEGTPVDLDGPLQAELATGRVVMVASFAPKAQGPSDYLLPAQDYLLPLPNLDLRAHLGLADLALDDDGVVRHFRWIPAGLQAADGMPELSFAALLAARAQGPLPEGPLPAQWTLAGRTHDLNGVAQPIGFVGPPGSVPRLSLRTLLAPGAAQDPQVRALAGKVVIIGGDYAGHNDLHATPYVAGFWRARGDFMNGAEIQANIVQTLLGGRQPQTPSWVWRGLIPALLLALLSLGLWRAPLRRGLLYSALALPLTAAVGWGLFAQDLLYPSAALATGVLAQTGLVLGARYLLEERERRRVTQLFGRYVSTEVVTQLLSSGQSPALGGQRQTITVLFSDIRGFTTLSERLRPEEVVELLNHYFGRICPMVLAEGGTIDKFIGDAIMVLFGTPLAQPDHADRALRCALQMAAAAEDCKTWMRARFAGRDLPDFAIGIGVHTGAAVVGTIGSQARAEFTAIGDTVNTAARIESQTRAMACTVLCSQDTLDACTAPVHTGRTQTVQVKGRAQAVQLHELLDLHGADDPRPMPSSQHDIHRSAPP